LGTKVGDHPKSLFRASGSVSKGIFSSSILPDTSPTAKLQAQYTDLLILNKHDLATDRQLDTVLDHLYTLNDETPMLRHSPSAPLSPSVLFGLDSQLFSRREEEEEKFKALGWEGNGHAGEVESVGVYRGGEGERTEGWRDMTGMFMGKDVDTRAICLRKRERERRSRRCRAGRRS
jgi:G3E family GTPase